MSRRGELARLRALPTPALDAGRRRAVGLRAGDVFERASRNNARARSAAHALAAIALSGAAALYLLWALRVARTFG